MVGKKLSRGFTLVELLVVIVVIGILVAITLITYRGVTSRANAAAELSDASQWVQALTIYEGKNGMYPLPDGGDGTATCLGTSFPATADFDEGSCYVYDYGTGTSSISADPAVNSSLEKIAQLPSSNFPTASISMSGVTLKTRGIIYLANTTAFINDGTGKLYRAVVYYYTTGSNVSCGTGILGTNVINGVTFNVCNFYLK